MTVFHTNWYRGPLLARYRSMGILMVLLVALAVAVLKLRWTRRSNNRRRSPPGICEGPQEASMINQGKRIKHDKAQGRSRPLTAFLNLAREKSLLLSTLAVPQALSDDQLARFYPRHFESHGHVAVVRVNNGVALDDFKHYTECFARSLLPLVIDVVVCDTGGISGELRTPVHTVVWHVEPTSRIVAAKNSLKAMLRKQPCSRGSAKGGDCAGLLCTPEMKAEFTAATDSITFTTHVENKVLYSFDVLKVMFSSGNTKERMHFGSLSAKGETVVDMFAGIGYFTIPLAINGGVKKIVALEKNPSSVTFLQYNALQNGVLGKVEIYCGDNREVTGSSLCGQCDRVIMGYIPDCSAFLQRAVSFLRRDKKGYPTGTVHYHFLASKQHGHTTAMRHIVNQLGEEVVGYVEVEDIRLVKSYAPNRFHYVADFKFSLRLK